MKSSVASTGWCPSHPPRTTSAVFVSVIDLPLLRPPVSQPLAGLAYCLDVLPAAGGGSAGFDGGQYALHLQGVGEGRFRLAFPGNRVDEVHHLVGKAVFVAETVAGGPPIPHVRVFRLRDQDPPEPGIR